MKPILIDRSNHKIFLKRGYMITNLKKVVFSRIEFSIALILFLIFWMPCNLVFSQEKIAEKELDTQKIILKKEDSIKEQVPTDNWKAPDQPQWVSIHG
jgi:hypothetical protein